MLINPPVPGTGAVLFGHTNVNTEGVREVVCVPGMQFGVANPILAALNLQLDEADWTGTSKTSSTTLSFASGVLPKCATHYIVETFIRVVSGRFVSRRPAVAGMGALDAQADIQAQGVVHLNVAVRNRAHEQNVVLDPNAPPLPAGQSDWVFDRVIDSSRSFSYIPIIDHATDEVTLGATITSPNTTANETLFQSAHIVEDGFFGTRCTLSASLQGYINIQA